MVSTIRSNYGNRACVCVWGRGGGHEPPFTCLRGPLDDPPSPSGVYRGTTSGYGDATLINLHKCENAVRMYGNQRTLWECFIPPPPQDINVSGLCFVCLFVFAKLLSLNFQKSRKLRQCATGDGYSLLPQGTGDSLLLPDLLFGFLYYFNCVWGPSWLVHVEFCVQVFCFVHNREIYATLLLKAE